MAKRKKKKGSKILSTIIALLILIVGGYFAKDEILPTSYEIPEGNMAVHFLDVGQGDSTLFMTEDGVVLVDASVSDAGPTIVEYLKKQGVSKIDYFILTHPDADHIGGAMDVLNAFTIENVIMPNKSHTSNTYKSLVARIDELGINVIMGESGGVYNVGDMEMTILAPVKGVEYSDNNNWSIVHMVRFGNVKILMTGDASKESENILLSTYTSAQLKADLLKVGHHGSSSSTTANFLKAVDPDYAVISCGLDNEYGHPHTEVVNRLENAGVTIRVTKDEGAIVYMTDGTTLTAGQ
ncbi:MAG: MBL fold metallo-hydrolase [Clostridia bacterium]|nr:MBL fold metallo-hydrolase [Clostridia bacterium]